MDALKHIPWSHWPWSHWPWSRWAEFAPQIVFQWPELLWLLLLGPLLIGLYVLILRRRRRNAVRFGNTGLLKQALGGSTRRRHIPPALMLIALLLLIVGVARPSALVSMPSNRATVILAMDVSGSMRAADVLPTRIAAAETAAKKYVKDQPREVLIGIVAFAATALLVQTPTVDRGALTAAIDRFELQRGTAVGSGILTAMSTLFPDEDFPITRYSSDGYGGGYGGFGYDRYGGYGSRFGGGSPLGERRQAKPKKPHVPVEPGSYKNAVIILLTDGATNAGYDPVEAARIASNYGVRIYTVGFGTAKGNIVGFGGFSMRAQLDEDALKKIADMTRGRYFHATSGADLQAIYGNLGKQLIVETKEMEITSFFAASAAVLMMLAAMLSLLWFGRLV